MKNTKKAQQLFPRAAVLLSSAFILMLSASAPAQPTGYGDVAGYVRDSSGAGIPNVDVAIIEAVTGEVLEGTTTVFDGSFYISALPSGPDCFMRASMPPYPEQYWTSVAIPTLHPVPEGRFIIPANDTIVLSMTLQMRPEPGDTTPPDTTTPPPTQSPSMVRVMIADSMGNPLTGYSANIQLIDANSHYNMPMQKLSTGEYVIIAPKPSQTYAIYIMGSQYPPQYYNPQRNTTGSTYTFAVGIRDTVAIVMKLVRTPTAAYSFLFSIQQDSAMGPIRNCKIELYDSNTTTGTITIAGSAYTDSTGFCSFANLSLSSYYVKATASGYPAQWLSSGGSTDMMYSRISYSVSGNAQYFTLTHNPLASRSLLRVQVKGANGALMNVSTLYLRGTTGFGPQCNAVNTGLGTYEFARLVAGSYQLWTMPATFSGVAYPMQYYNPAGNSQNPTFTIPMFGTDTQAVVMRMVPQPAFEGRIYGMVRDSMLARLAGIQLALFKPESLMQAPTFTTASDSAGSFSFDKLPQQNYMLFIRAQGAYPAQWYSTSGKNTVNPSASVSASSSMSYEVILTTAPVSGVAAVQARVSTPTGGTLPASAIQMIQLESVLGTNGTNYRGTLLPGTANIYAFYGVLSGSYRCHILPTTFPEQYYDPSGNTAYPRYMFSISRTDSVFLDIKLSTAPAGDTTHPPVVTQQARISGGVRTASGISGLPALVNLAGIRVMAIPTNNGVPGSGYWTGSNYVATTDASGAYTITGIVSGTYYVQTWADTGNYIVQFYSRSDSVSSARRLTLSDTAAVTGVDFYLRPGGIVRGTIVDSISGAPIANARASVYLNRVNSTFQLYTQTDPLGTFSFRCVPAGVYTINTGGGAYYQPYNPQGQQTQYTVTEGSTTVAQPIKVIAGSVIFVPPLHSPTWNESMYGLMGVSLYLYPAQLFQTMRDTIISPSTRLWIQSMPQYPDFRFSNACAPGDYLILATPAPLGQKAYDGNPGKTVLPSAGWATQMGKPELLASQPMHLAALDTVMFQIPGEMLPPGYSMAIPVTLDNGASPSNSNVWIQAYCKKNPFYYLVAESSPLTNGRFELNGLIANMPYYLKVTAQGYPEQWYSPSGNTARPSAPFSFNPNSTLSIRVISNPVGYQPPGPGPDTNTTPRPDTGAHYTGYMEPISLWGEFPTPGFPVLKMHVDTQKHFDSLYLYSRDRTGANTIVYRVKTQPGIADYQWPEHRSLTAMTYNYVAVVKNAATTMRSYVMQQDLRDCRTLPPDSLWINAFGCPWGVQIQWGAGRGVTNTGSMGYQSIGDSIVVYRRLKTTTSWTQVESRSAMETNISDDSYHGSSDSGKTFEYKVALMKAGIVARWSSISSLSLDAAFYALVNRGKRLMVGSGQQYATIQSAVNAAGKYDQISVLPGTYAEQVTIPAGKLIRIQGEWRNGYPPVIDAGNAPYAFNIAYTPSYSWDRIEISGMKIQNAREAIITLSDISVSQCLFVNCSNDIRTALGFGSSINAAIAQAIAADPFISSSLNIGLYQNTFIGGMNGMFAVALSSIPVDYDPHIITPGFIASANAWVSNSIFATWAGSKGLMGISGSASVNGNHNLFWNVSVPMDTVHYYFTDNITNQSPNFTDTTWYFLPDNSPLRQTTAYGRSSPGYDDRRFNNSGGGNGGGGGPPAVSGLKKTITGLKTITLSWTALPALAKIERYVVYRVPGDSALFTPVAMDPLHPDSLYWSCAACSDSTKPIAEVHGTSYVDTTVVMGRKYLYAVAGIDSAGHHGNVSMPYPPPLSSYVISISQDAFPASKMRFVKGGFWAMIGPFGPDSIALPPSPTRALYHWEDTKTADKLMSQYAEATGMRPGQGYWFFSDRDTLLTAPSTAFDNMVRAGDRYIIRLTKGATGWNQIVSPYPFPVAPSWLTSLSAFEWIYLDKRYAAATSLKPWTAVWVHINADTTLVINGKATSVTGAPLAKIAANDGWEIGLSLSNVDGSSDRDNSIGVVAPALAKTVSCKNLEPPRAFNFAQLFILGADGAMLSKQIVTSQPIPSGRIEWAVGVASSSDPQTLTFDGLAQVPAPVLVLWVTDDTVVDLRQSPSIKIAAHDQTAYGYVVATTDRRDRMLYGGVFDLRNNYPNPFTTMTTVEFIVPYQWEKNGLKKQSDGADVSLAVYDMTGRQIASLVAGTRKVGVYHVTWDGRDSYGRRLPTGMYMLRMKAGNFMKTIRTIKM